MEFHFGDRNKDAITRSTQDWRTAGNIGYLITHGYLYNTDRRDSQILSGGVDLYPAKLERVPGKHPAVLDCVVEELPSEESGQRVRILVELADVSRAKGRRMRRPAGRWRKG